MEDQSLKLLKTPKPPYYAVISTSIHHGEDLEVYEALWSKALHEAQQLDGFLGEESIDEKLPDGKIKSITVVYYRSLSALEAWRSHSAHTKVKKDAKQKWFVSHNIRICHVIDQYGDL